MHSMHQSLGQAARQHSVCSARPGALCSSTTSTRPRNLLLVCQATKCHYTVLGVHPTASCNEIKSAFRKLALQLHPDVNDAPNATERFKGVKEAYEVLSDPQQRAAYNRQRAVQAQSSYTRSTRSGSGSGTSYADSHTAPRVVYEYGEVDETFEEAAAAGFWGWYQESGSWQSSWRSNRKKRQQQQAQAQAQAQQAQQAQQQQQEQQQQRQAHQRQQQSHSATRQRRYQAQYQQAAQQHAQRQHQNYATAQQMLSQLDAPTLRLVRGIFGPDMQHLNSLEELVEVLEDLEGLRRQGITLDDTAFSSRGRGQGSSTSSNKQATRGGPRHSTGTSSTSSSSTSGSRAGAASQASTRSTSSGKTSSSRTSRSASSSTSSTRRARKQPSNSKGLPPFDELSADELYELMSCKTDRKTAAAAKAWVQQAMAAKTMHPSVASSLGFLLAMDYISEDLVDSPLDWGFGEMFDPDSERSRGRARAGSPYDYVRYSSDGDSSSSDDDDVANELAGVWRDLDDLAAILGLEL